MTAKVVQFKNIGAVTFFKNRRSKNIKLSVKPDNTVRVSMPFYITYAEAAGFVSKNIDWINSQKQKFSTKKNELQNGKIIQTKLNRIIIRKGLKNDAKAQENKVLIEVRDLDSEESMRYIEHILTEVYRFEAKKLLPVSLYELANKFGFQYNKVTIRNNRRNWGSCSAKNNISLNLQMMKLPDELIDYILLHELVHTEIKNHGPEFWFRLNSITGGKAKILAKQVKQYSTYTL